MKTILFALILLNLPAVSWAQIAPSSNRSIYYPYSNKWAAFDAESHAKTKTVGHFFEKHEHLINDLILVGSFEADAGSGVACQTTHHCIEANSLLPRHPSALVSVSFSSGEALLAIAADHVTWHYAKKFGKHQIGYITWATTSAIATGEFFTVRSNVRAIQTTPVGLSLSIYPGGK